MRETAQTDVDKVEITSLLPRQLAMLQAATISPEVIGARGYRRVQDQAELLDLGFAVYIDLNGNEVVDLACINPNLPVETWWPLAELVDGYLPQSRGS